MEVSESGRRVLIQHRWINVGIEIVDIASGWSLVDQPVLQHVLATQEDGQPFVVTDLLILGNVDLSRLLEQRAIIVVWIQCRQGVRNAIVFAQQDRLENGQSRILIDPHVSGTVAHLTGINGITIAGHISREWQPLGSVTLLHNHPASLELTDIAVLLNGVAIYQREIQVRSDHRQLLCRSTLVLTVRVPIRQSAHKVEALSAHLGVSRIVRWHNNGETGLVGGVQANQATIVGATTCGMLFCWIIKRLYPGIYLARDVLLTGLSATGLHAHIVGHDLAPLHVVQRELRIGYILFSESHQGNKTSTGQLITCHGSGGCRNTVGIFRSQQATIPNIGT